jgi:hypothetical protein
MVQEFFVCENVRGVCGLCEGLRESAGVRAVRGYYSVCVAVHQKMCIVHGARGHVRASASELVYGIVRWCVRAGQRRWATRNLRGACALAHTRRASVAQVLRKYTLLPASTR